MWKIKRIVGTGEDRWRHALFRACLDENDCSLWTAETIPLLKKNLPPFTYSYYTMETPGNLLVEVPTEGSQNFSSALRSLPLEKKGGLREAAEH